MQISIDEELPFCIPDGWEWVRLGGFLEIERGGSPRPIKEFITDEPNGINWIKIGDAEPGSKYIISTKQKIKPSGMKKSRFVQSGDFLLTNSMSFGRPYILKTDGCIHDGWLVIRKPELIFDVNYLFHLLSSVMVYEQLAKLAGGSTVDNLNIDKTKACLVPLPPLAEQCRIVEALDKYLALVDEIEQSQADLDVLFAQLRSKVLDLAIRGELAAQDPNDEPADKLLERIHAEKVAMVERGELKPKDIKGDTVIFTGSDGLRYEKPADGSGEARCIEDEIPFELPCSWSWTRLLTPVALDPKNVVEDEIEASFLPMAAIEEGFRNVYHPETRRWAEIKQGFTQFADNDVVFAKISPCFENGKYFIAKDLMNGVGAGTTELFVLRSPSADLNRSYLFHFLASDYFMGDAKKTFMGSVGQQRIKRDYLERMLLPVPPAPEQARIVDVIEEVLKPLK